MASAMPTALIERHGLQPLQGVYSGHNYADALYQGMASAPAGRLLGAQLCRCFVSGHGFSRADQAHKKDVGFSPCGNVLLPRK